MQFMPMGRWLAMRVEVIILINEVDLVDPADGLVSNDVLGRSRPLVIAQNGGEIIAAPDVSVWLPAILHWFR